VVGNFRARVNTSGGLFVVIGVAGRLVLCGEILVGVGALGISVDSEVLCDVCSGYRCW
jgi:hypothetical protein